VQAGGLLVFCLGSRVPLAPGMTLSNEPGICVLGEFGSRLEYIIAVSACGARVFDAWQDDPSRPA
jgi:Xaa-Pro aminopeptidase